MTTEEERIAARALLDAARAGGPVCSKTITECLIVLGDLPNTDDSAAALRVSTSIAPAMRG